jgi:oligosaccharide reducing-end xylanase
MAQGALVARTEEEMEIAKKWVLWFWNQPLRKGVRRYYDNCLYMFALLALSGNYRIW